VRRWRGAYALIPSRGSVDTHGEIIVTEAGLEDTSVVVTWHVPAATHFIVDVLAIACSIGSSASAEAKLRVRHVIRPLVVLQAIAKRISIHKPSNRVPIPVCSMRVELPSIVSLRDVELRQVADASDLHVVRCLHEVYASQRVVRDDACAVARLQAPGDLFTLGITNAARRRRRPEAEVVNVVDPRGLARRAL